MFDRADACVPAATLVATAEEYDQFVATMLPDILDRATAQARRCFRETGQWVDDLAHEKLVLRWGYELTERFVAAARAEVPCRPMFLLDSYVARWFSQPEPVCVHGDLPAPLGRFLDGLLSRAVVSRDALMALFYHLYGFGQGRIVRLLGLGQAESQRVYKNFDRWRKVGWAQTVAEIGLADGELEGLGRRQLREPERLNADAERMLGLLQAHYRKSEPEHYPCLTRRQWSELIEQGYGYDYRAWHLALCRECLIIVTDLRPSDQAGEPKPRVNITIHPPVKGGAIAGLLAGLRARRNGHGNGRPTTRLP